MDGVLNQYHQKRHRVVFAFVRREYRVPSCSVVGAGLTICSCALVCIPPTEDVAGPHLRKYTTSCSPNPPDILSVPSFRAFARNLLAVSCRAHPCFRFRCLQVAALHTKLLSVCREACEAQADYTVFPEEWLFHHRYEFADECLRGPCLFFFFGLGKKNRQARRHGEWPAWPFLSSAQSKKIIVLNLRNLLRGKEAFSVMTPSNALERIGSFCASSMGCTPQLVLIFNTNSRISGSMHSLSLTHENSDVGRAGASVCLHLRYTARRSASSTRIKTQTAAVVDIWFDPRLSVLNNPPAHLGGAKGRTPMEPLAFLLDTR